MAKKDLLFFRGMSDASAAIAIDQHRFVVANDEDNVLRVYDVREPGPAVQEFPLNEFLQIAGDDPHAEADLEGAVQAGRCIYWIGSHGRSSKGKHRPNRHRFFCTQFGKRGKKLTMKFVGSPCTSLLESMVETPCAAGLDLQSHARLDKEQKKKLSPKKKGINVEGITASRDGRILFIGFRNPVLDVEGAGEDCTLVMPLLNGRAVAAKKAEPTFGAPLLWDLGGLGVRAMQYSKTHDAYFILVGPPGSGSGDFYLHRWSGKAEEEPARGKKIRRLPDDFNPECIVYFEGEDRLLLLSDDGNRLVDAGENGGRGKKNKDGTCRSKDLADMAKKEFRGMWVEAE